MYKRASRGTGGAGINGWAKAARRPSKHSIEKAASLTEYGRSLVLDLTLKSPRSILRKDESEICQIIQKLADGYTSDKAIVEFAKRLNSEKEFYFSDDDKVTAAIEISKIIKRLSRYRTSQD